MTWFRAVLAILLLSLAAIPAVAQPQFPPRPAGAVHDGANILPDADEQLLDARLREYNQRTGRALIVATVPSLEGETIEQYAVRLFQTWGIGGAESDQGLLLLVAPNEREVRIEVGYGLHQYVTDILSGRIIREQITPRFREGDFAGGINAGVDALITQLDRDPADARAVAEAAAAAERQRGQRGEQGFPFGFFIWLGFLFFFFILPMLGRLRGGRRYRDGDRDGHDRSGAGAAIGNVILWSALNAAMNSGRGGRSSGWGGGGFGGGGGGGFGGFGGGMSGGGGASGSW